VNFILRFQCPRDTLCYQALDVEFALLRLPTSKCATVELETTTNHTYQSHCLHQQEQQLSRACAVSSATWLQLRHNAPAVKFAILELPLSIYVHLQRMKQHERHFQSHCFNHTCGGASHGAGTVLSGFGCLVDNCANPNAEMCVTVDLEPRANHKYQ